ncbi:hypothetical protein [Microlunatus flavus]|uniref:hypothetical protein n=1 Tax=Microlunatus flavus TaxID=1036181 RepID=UPI001113E51C|nr:hypothetical protein [Microlunatus flavus]
MSAVMTSPQTLPELVEGPKTLPELVEGPKTLPELVEGPKTLPELVEGHRRGQRLSSISITSSTPTRPGPFDKLRERCAAVAA